jgi:hypothetical protein
LESAKAALQPLEDDAAKLDDAVNMLMQEYQNQTGTAPSVPVRRGGRGGKRGKRSLSAVVMTAATRLLNQEHKAGKKRVQAVTAATERATSLARGRSETLSDELIASISAKAESI